ncbi:acetyltransferase-like isoleucine patch superfamily enzyme [Desulfobaculum xiamenense]|uniref:Acetyltransferase-like isoleucine patch superfamily enzyme n=1 Tax=Desulfobaculum xiamenense TaxID=995050 RepID=A0A846QVS3_9BACT|nr:acyltransferase [Desulfobaculum xiamenense]NJB69214.1 acetyltransferase-like isoleucine patch superfamily enzyme [Desulfobaculum xiamenense]
MTRFSCIAADVRLGAGVVLRDFVNLYGCEVGDGTRIGTFVEIQKNASVGRNCKISSHTFVCEGVRIGDGVFVGHNVSFVNDPRPRAVGDDGEPLGDGEWTVVPTVVEDRAAIGSGAVILCGVTIGRGALVGAGAVVTRDVPPGEVWVGNPARFLKRVEDM